MGTLETALNLFKEECGELDNVKFLLAPGVAMDTESVAAEVHALAAGWRSGEYAAQTEYLEDQLRDRQIAL